MPNWKERFLARQKELNLTNAAIERSAGFTSGAIREWIQRDKTPSVDNAIVLASAVGLTLHELFQGDEVRLNLFVHGVTQGQSMWARTADKHSKVVPLTLASEDLVSIEIDKDANAPHLGFRQGDIVSGIKVPFSRASNLIGHECIVEAKDGSHYIGILMAGNRHGTANIRPFDPSKEDVKNVAIEWVAPIKFILRGT